MLAQGIAHHRSGDLPKATALYEDVLKIQPDHFGALYLLGVLSHYTGNPRRAVEFLRRALDVNPSDHDCLELLGRALAALGRSLLASNDSGAAAILQQAVAASPDDAALRCDLGDALTSLGKSREAAAEYARATEIDNSLARPWYSVGCLQNERGAFANAADCFRKALSLFPDWPEAKHNLGQALFELGRVEDAIGCFREAALGPNSELPIAMLAVAIPGCPSATNFEIFEARRRWAEALPNQPRAPRAQVPQRPLRIGYVSSFFARDNWMKPVWGLINAHDRRRFAIHLFSDKPASEIRHGYNAHPSDSFYDTTGLTNDDLSALIRSCDIDLLIDLNGYSNMRRLPMYALRPAPVIAGWFNMYATTGMSCFDYLIGDACVLPADEECFYSEKVLRVPGSYLTFQVAYPVPEVAPPPSLKNGRFTFGCLAPLYKITPQLIAVFSHILNGVAGSSLLLRNRALKSPRNAEYLRSAFEEQGIAAERVQMEGPADHYQFLETYSRIDLALDTFPYNGGTTTTEALWQGVPVLAFSGDRWVSRTSASILRAANLPQFVCSDLDGYVKLAAAIANSAGDRSSLASLRQNMRDHLLASPVCDTAAFAKNMEQLYSSMFF